MLVLETDVLHASSEYSCLKSQAAESVKCRTSGTMQKTGSYTAFGQQEAGDKLTRSSNIHRVRRVDTDKTPNTSVVIPA